MSNEEKLTMLKQMLNVTDDSEDGLLTVYLLASEREILGWRYSYAVSRPTVIPEEYEMTQIFAVVAGYSMIGAEGQLLHIENGVHRTFKYDDMIAYIRSHVIPVAKVI